MKRLSGAYGRALPCVCLTEAEEEPVAKREREMQGFKIGCLPFWIGIG
uniref:Uncharacterized protein n=1 Tax=Fundulus heteroclitus TaxID=8078 RepID=A0A3Q2PHX7_FUNHE